MAARVIGIERTCSVTRDTDGHREYKAIFLVECEDTVDGPATALFAAGLPRPGDPWVFGGENDLFAYCKKDANVTPRVTNEPNRFFEIELTFTTKPAKFCQDDTVESPLLIPQKVSGTFNTYTEEITRDRFNQPVMNSCFEQLKGAVIEFDRTYPVVRIEQNVVDLQLPLLVQMEDTVNASSLWGLPPRCIKFNCKGYEKKYYQRCQVYYTRQLEFEVRYSTFDRDILDEGTKVLKGHYKEEVDLSVASGKKFIYLLDKIAGNDPDPKNPRHFIKYKDPEGNVSKTPLNGAGLPAGSILGSQGYYFVIVDNSIGDALTETGVWIPAVHFDPSKPFPDQYARRTATLGPDSFEPVGPPIDPLQDGALPYYRIYRRGELVDLQNAAGYLHQIFICIQDAINEAPLTNNLDSDSVNTSYWVRLIGGRFGINAGPFNSLKDKGNFSLTATYTKGDYVKDSSVAPSAFIHIEAYRATEFRLLGIPEIL